MVRRCAAAQVDRTWQDGPSDGVGGSPSWWCLGPRGGGDREQVAGLAVQASHRAVKVVNRMARAWLFFRMERLTRLGRVSIG